MEEMLHLEYLTYGDYYDTGNFGWRRISHINRIREDRKPQTLSPKPDIVGFGVQTFSAMWIWG